METLTTTRTTRAVQKSKVRFRWQRWLVVFGMGLVGALAGLNEAEKRLPNDSPAKVQAIENSIAELVSGAVLDKMPRMVERDEYRLALLNLSQAMDKLSNYASNLETQPVPTGFAPTYPNYDAAREKFLRAFGRLHTRDNRLKATILYYDVAGWYPKPPTEEHNWRKLNETIPWRVSEVETAERIGFAVGTGGTLAIFTWVLVVLIRLGWHFLLARIRDVSQAVRG